MKKVLLAVIACIAVTTVVKAQTAKGNLFIGTSIGSTSYNSATDDYSFTNGTSSNTNRKSYNLGLSPSIGVFLTDHFILGGNLGVTYNHIKTTDNTAASSDMVTTNTTLFSIGPFARYYIFNSTPSKTMFYLQAAGNIGAGSGSSSGSGSNFTSNGDLKGIFSYNGSGGIGITHFIRKNIGLDVGVGYVYEHEKYTSTTTTTTGGAGSTSTSEDVATHTHGVALSAGFHFFLP